MLQVQKCILRSIFAISNGIELLISAKGPWRSFANFRRVHVITQKPKHF